MSKVSDGYDVDEFAALLAEAESFAESEWAVNFVDDLQERFEQYGANMYLSDKQESLLKRIASGEL